MKRPKIFLAKKTTQIIYQKLKEIITTDSTDGKKTVKIYYEKLDANKIENNGQVPRKATTFQHRKRNTKFEQTFIH